MQQPLPTIETLEVAVKNAERSYGLHHILVADHLDRYAQALRTSKRLLDAVNVEARAKSIRAKAAEWDAKKSARLPHLLHAESTALVQSLEALLKEHRRDLEIVLEAVPYLGAGHPRDLIGWATLYFGYVAANINGEMKEPQLVILTDIARHFWLWSDLDEVGIKGAQTYFDKHFRDNNAWDLPKQLITVLHENDDNTERWVTPTLKHAWVSVADKIASAGGPQTESDRDFVSQFIALCDRSSVEQLSNGAREDDDDLPKLLKALNSLIGLQRVKQDVTQLCAFLQVQQMRESRGIHTEAPSRHLVFYGNPGTGKTTVARILGRIYKALGILSKGHLIETDRAGLVAGYVGQTAINVKEMVTSALGGVLFIDEAYTLTSNQQDSFGHDTLLKMMEDHRSDLIVIVAGYSTKMANFIASNPGLKSRFNKYIQFDDYVPDELMQIFAHSTEHAGLKLS